jgi:iron complex outermembrane receptor protein
MRLGIVMLFWVFTLNIYAQTPVDSAIILQEVTVIGNFEKQFLPGNNIIIPKAKTLQFYQSDNISEILRQQSSIHIKEYGNGMLSTIAFRGTNASQTSVLWNNFNINSYTLGLTDFSLLPTQAVDEVTLIPGSGSSVGGNGAFGGSVLLQNNVDFNASPSITLSQQAGSFGQYSSSINAKSSFYKWAFDTRVYWGKADNDFRILATEKKQTNAYFERKGINQSVGYQINERSNLKAAVWYNDNFREIQPSLAVSRNINNQEDKNFRSTLNYEYLGNTGKLSVGSGFFQDEMTYRLDQAVSYLQVNRIESFADYNYQLNPVHQLKFSARHNYISANNQSYEGGGAVEERFSLGLLLKGSLLFNGFDYALHLRQQLVSGVNIPISPYLGFSALIWNQNGHQVKLKANSSYNYRLPTLNDRFWNNAGNPELNAETGWNKELGLSSTHLIDDAKFETSITAFHNQVDNWIQWTPDSTGSFRPRNIKQVVAQGLESTLAYEIPLGNRLNFQTNMQYSFTKSTVKQTESNTNEVGKQLIYTPLHKANASFSVLWRSFSLDSFHQLTGKVYTTNTNSEIYALEAFLLTDVGITWQSDSWTFSGRVKNIFNKDYQVYAGYAMPGRNYQLSINYQLNFNRK